MPVRAVTVPAAARPAPFDALDGVALPAAAGGCFTAALRRELRGLWRERFEALAAGGFFVLVLLLWPLALPEPALLPRLAPAAAWTAALLAVLLGSLRLFQADAANGALEQQLLAASPLAALGGRLLAQALAVAPLLPASALTVPFFGLPAPEWPALALSLVLGLPVLVGLCALGAALSLASRGGGVLLALLVLPLAVPVLLLGLGTAQGVPAAPWLLGALAAAALALLPRTVLAALRMGVE